ncbi:hypothetical protein D3C87_722170 [compost metagenome]
MFHAQRNTVFLLIVFQDFGGDFLANRQYFRRVTYTAPCQVGDVQQAIDTAQIHERAVVGDIFDDAGHDRAFFQRFHQFLTLFAHRSFDDGAAGQNHVVTLAIQLDHFEFEGFAFEWGRVFDRTGINQRARQECADAVGQHGQTAFDFTIDGTDDDFARFHRFFQSQPRSQTLGFIARQDGIAETVFQRFDRHGNEVTNFDFQFAVVVLEFFDRDECFGFEASVHDHEIVVEAHDFSGNNFAGAHILTRQRFLEERSKTFHTGRFVSCNSRHRVHTGYPAEIARCDLNWVRFLTHPDRPGAVNGHHIAQQHAILLRRHTISTRFRRQHLPSFPRYRGHAPLPRGPAAQSHGEYHVRPAPANPSEGLPY